MSTDDENYISVSKDSSRFEKSLPCLICFKDIMKNGTLKLLAALLLFSSRYCSMFFINFLNKNFSSFIGRAKGKSKKWRLMLAFPHISECLHLKDEIGELLLPRQRKHIRKLLLEVNTKSSDKWLPFP